MQEAFVRPGPRSYDELLYFILLYTFIQEAFVRLGPRRYDELQLQMGFVNDGEISAAEAVARARYFMCPEHENLHDEFAFLLLGKKGGR